MYERDHGRNAGDYLFEELVEHQVSYYVKKSCIIILTRLK